MSDVHQLATRWLRRAIHAMEKNGLDFYSISPILSVRLDAWLHTHGYAVHKDVIVTSRFEEVEVFIGPVCGPMDRIFLCFKPYVAKCPTIVFEPARKRAT